MSHTDYQLTFDGLPVTDIMQYLTHPDTGERLVYCTYRDGDDHFSAALPVDLFEVAA